MGARKRVRAAADILGIGLSVLCLIHCLVLPVFIAFAPVLLENLPGDDATHRALAVVIGLVGFLAFRSGYKVHRRRWLLWLFSLGLLLISVAAALGAPVLTSSGEAAVTVAGGLLLVTAHLFNQSFCRSCAMKDCSDACSPGGAGKVMSPAIAAGRDLR